VWSIILGFTDTREITIGDKTCTSCVYDGTTGCTTFDCTNNADTKGQAGDSCNNFLLRILAEIGTLLEDPDFDPAVCVDGAAGLSGKFLAGSTLFANWVVGYLIA
jgi:hypothetical protein